MERLCIFIHIYNKPYISLWPIRSQFDMDLARAPRRARLTARKKGSGYENAERPNLVPRACDPWEGNEGSGIIRCRKPGILAKIELRIHFNGQSDSSLKRIIPEPSFPSQGSQARGTRLGETLVWCGHVSHDHVLYSAGVATVA